MVSQPQYKDRPETNEYFTLRKAYVAKSFSHFRLDRLVFQPRYIDDF